MYLHENIYEILYKIKVELTNIVAFLKDHMIQKFNIYINFNQHICYCSSLIILMNPLQYLDVLI